MSNLFNVESQSKFKSTEIMNLILLYRKYIPKYIRDLVYYAHENYRNIQLKKAIIKYFESMDSIENDQKEVVDYLRNGQLGVFPYKFSKKYKSKELKVYRDDKGGLPYLYHDNKKLYFKKSWSDRMVKDYYNSLRVEQDRNSPHRYLSEEFTVKQDDVLADIGAAEGVFTLSNIEELSKAYLFEPELDWIEALEATFEPWKDKIVIISKFVGEVNNSSTVTVDEYFKNKSITFIKADVEGSELKVLEGSNNILTNRKDIKIAVCVYHKKEDEAILSKRLIDLKYSIEISKGYMIFLDKWYPDPPYLRRGILRGQKLKV